MGKESANTIQMSFLLNVLTKIYFKKIFEPVIPVKEIIMLPLGQQDTGSRENH